MAKSLTWLRTEQTEQSWSFQPTCRCSLPLNPRFFILFIIRPVNKCEDDGFIFTKQVNAWRVWLCTVSQQEEKAGVSHCVINWITLWGLTRAERKIVSNINKGLGAKASIFAASWASSPSNCLLDRLLFTQLNHKNRMFRRSYLHFQS